MQEWLQNIANIKTKPKFANSSSSTMHVKSVHKNKKYSCSLCVYQALHAVHLRNHVTSVHEGVKHICTICGHKASTQGNLKEHVQTQHKGKKYQCNVCDKEYKSQSGLRAHKITVHEGKRNKCNICEYSATQKSSLSVHIKISHLQQSFKCRICDYQATFKHHLTIHVNNIHQTRERVKCPDCNKSLKQWSLSGHRKSFHSGEEPQFSCNICTYQTNRKFDLTKHIRNMHESGKWTETLSRLHQKLVPNMTSS